MTQHCSITQTYRLPLTGWLERGTSNGYYNSPPPLTTVWIIVDNKVGCWKTIKQKDFTISTANGLPVIFLSIKDFYYLNIEMISAAAGICFLLSLVYLTLVISSSSLLLFIESERFSLFSPGHYPLCFSCVIDNHWSHWCFMFSAADIIMSVSTSEQPPQHCPPEKLLLWLCLKYVRCWGATNINIDMRSSAAHCLLSKPTLI